jgi:hypothetical protein
MGSYELIIDQISFRTQSMYRMYSKLVLYFVFHMISRVLCFWMSQHIYKKYIGCYLRT